MPTSTSPRATEDLRRAAEAHRSAIKAQPAYMAASLQDALGQKLVAYIVNVSDPKTVTRWATEERKPTGDNETRLRTAFYVFQLLNELESSHTVRAWFAGLNPLLGDESPAIALQEGRAQEVVAAAKAFVSDG
jgi:hypothetical protein